MTRTWTMTRRARSQAAECAITDAEIAYVIADPDVDVAVAEDPRLRCVGRSGLYAVVDPVSHTVVTLAEQPMRTPWPAGACLTVLIRRRPVADRPRRDVPAALLAPPQAPLTAPVAGPRRVVPSEPAPVLPSVLAGKLTPRTRTAPPPSPRSPARAAAAPPPAASPRLGASAEPCPVLPSVLKGTLAPPKRTAAPPSPGSRVDAAPPPQKDKLAGVHPGIAASVRAELARRGLGMSRVVVHSPTNVEIR